MRTLNRYFLIPLLSLQALCFPFIAGAESPSQSAYRAQEVSLGQKLFFDRRLSANGTLSCAMCHIPEQGFTQNQLATPVGFKGRTVKRNSPTLLNVSHRRVLFHDGREFTLEDQVWSPLLNNREMGNVSIGVVLQRLKKMDNYRQLFGSIYPSGITVQTVGAAIAAFERTLIADKAPFDQWYFEKNVSAIDEDARKGFALFNRHGCAQCHLIGSPGIGKTVAHFTDDEFHNTGIGFERSMKTPTRESSTVQLSATTFIQTNQTFDSDTLNDLGRYEVTGDPADRWKYRTPTLRNISLTAPYMHDGSVPNLEGVIRFYMQGGIANIQGGIRNEGLDEKLQPFVLKKEEIHQLISFLKTLTSPEAQVLAVDARKIAIGDY